MDELISTVNQVKPRGMPQQRAFTGYLFKHVYEVLDDIHTNNNLNPTILANLLKELAPIIRQTYENKSRRYEELKILLSEKQSQISSITDKTRDEYKKLDAEITSIYQEFHPLNKIFALIQSGIQLEERDLNHLLSLCKDQLHSVIEKHLKANFPHNYFENLKAQAASGKVHLLIETHFKDESLRKDVLQIRSHFAQYSEKEQIELIEYLAEICNELNINEKKELLQALKDERLLNTSMTNYLNLLSSIQRFGSASFTFFIDGIDKSSASNDLALKANYFLEKALPHIRHSKGELLQELDLVNLTRDLVLSAKKDEITQEIDINPSLSTGYMELSNLLKAKNATETLARLTKLSAENPELATIQEVTMLQNHLKDYLTDEFEDHEVREKSKVIRPKTGVSGFFSGFANKIGLKVDETEEVEIETKRTEKRKVEKHLDQLMIDAAIGSISGQAKEAKSYHFAVTQTLLTIEKLVTKYPAAKSSLLTFCKLFLQQDAAEPTQIKSTYTNLQLIYKELVALNDQNTVISICEHFGKMKPAEHGAVEAPFSFIDFLAIVQGKKLGAEVDYSNYPALEQHAKTRLIKVLTSLLNNRKECTRHDISRLINLCANKDQGEKYLKVLDALYENAPFPPLKVLNVWLEKAGQQDQPIEAFISAEYSKWSKHPVGRESVNGFDLEYGKTQARKMQGTEYTNDQLVAIDTEVKRVRELETKDLLAEIKSVGNNPTKLVPLMAEFLYRTKGLEERFNDEKQSERVWGQSFEINTTQYLAIHAMLKTGGAVTAEMGTGEGKSRCMMIAIACQYVLGKTADFVTADLSLATRDYLEYQAFFKALGAQTNLIYSDTPAEEYRIGGINFSDGANLSLFRNKARSEGKGHLVIDPDPKKRALMLDEADKTYHDSIDTRFNYSAQADASIRDMPWVYELMIAFFNDQSNVELYYASPDQCNVQFYNFARGKLSAIQMARLEFNPQIPTPVISQNQLEAWQSSALTALALELNKDFIIKSNVAIQTKEGTRIVSQAQLVSGGSASGTAKFSFGVHQCLHARLNLLKLKGTDDPLLAKELAQVNQKFYIDSENQIVYSSTSKAMIDDYNQGTILAVTGTKGSIEEMEETKELYGQGKPMTFIDIPRHRGLRRVDLPVSLAKNNEQKFQFFLEWVRESLYKNPPQAILLVCENDIESEELHRFLEKNLTAEDKQTMTSLTRISAQTPLSAEANHIDKVAGQPGAITVSTMKLGRGTDIKLGSTNTNGLAVYGSYLPRLRDYIQMIGRAGRFGAKGESRLILDREQIKTLIKKLTGKDTLPTEFYTATEAYLRKLQDDWDYIKQKERIVKNIVGDFRLSLTNTFFDKFYTPLTKDKSNDKDKLLISWQKFFDHTDKAWNDQWPAISEQLSKSPCDVTQVNTLLANYNAMVLDEWKNMTEYTQEQVKAGEIHYNAGEQLIKDAFKLPQTSLAIGDKQLKYFQREQSDKAQTPLTTIIAEKYDRAFVGRAVIYTHFVDSFTAFFSNIAAAWRGDGIWFPNLQAAMNGNMSWSQFFFGSWGSPLVEPKSESTESLAKPDEEVHEGSSYAQMLKSPIADAHKVEENEPNAELPSKSKPVGDTSAVVSLSSKEKTTLPTEEVSDDKKNAHM